MFPAARQPLRQHEFNLSNNPSMTIAAVAERALDAVTAQDVGTVI
ncbi:hypothetical protein [Streptomyces sp. JW3]